MQYKLGESVSILCQGKTISGIITGVKNHGSLSSPNLYICLDNNYMWRQKRDGGRIYKNEQVTIESCSKCDLPTFKVSQESLEEVCGYIDCDTCGTHLYPVQLEGESSCTRT